MTDFFTTFESIPNPHVELNTPIMDVDITGWAENITPEGKIIPKGKLFEILGEEDYIPQATAYIPDEYYSYTGNRAEYAKQFFLNKAQQYNIPLQEFQAAAIVGNFMVESSKDLDTKIIGDNGASIGIAQWQGSRRKSLMTFAKTNNLDANNLDTQLEFAWYEMTQGDEAKYKPLQKLLKTTSPDQATEVFMKVYERPGIPHLDRRLAYTKSLLK